MPATTPVQIAEDLLDVLIKRGYVPQEDTGHGYYLWADLIVSGLGTIRVTISDQAAVTVHAFTRGMTEFYSARLFGSAQLAAIIATMDAAEAGVRGWPASGTPPGEPGDCECVPGEVCAPCRARGYRNGLAGYQARIHPEEVTQDDIDTQDRADRAGDRDPRERDE